ncbi:hypothetical protein EK904_012512 [Melospiza melodia maxima]|nr:hypothetical protein EK904_012512 [Melospiza melodia maxima]
MRAELCWRDQKNVSCSILITPTHPAERKLHMEKAPGSVTLEFVCLSVETAFLGVFPSFRRRKQTITSFHSVLNPRSSHFGIRFIWIGSRPRGNLLPADKKR